MNVQTLHPAIDRTFNLWPSLKGSLAADVLGYSLSALPKSIQDDAWRASQLNQRGFPVELTFCDGQGGGALRFTTEVDRPDQPAGHRLAKALSIAANFGFAQWSDEVIEALERMHGDHGEELQFGAWLGVRQHHDLAVKIYAELPTGRANRLVDSLVSSLESTWDYRTWGGARAILLGVEADRLEIYYQALSPRPCEMASLLRRAGFDSSHAAAVLSCLEQAYGLSLERGMPAPEVGLSYALCRSEEGQPEVSAFTIYHMAEAVFGGDDSIRRGWLELLHQRGCDSAHYDALSRPLEGQAGGEIHHGMFGIVVPKNGLPSLALGLTPPAADAVS